MVIRNLLLVLALLCANTCMAVDTHTSTLDSLTRSLQSSVNGQQLTLPIISLNGNDHLEVCFDRLADDREYFRYELVHCNADWQPSDLVESEYLDGFNQADITDYDFSQLTATRYVHYSFSLPNNDMRPLLPGNYLIKIYHEDDRSRVVAKQRFLVSEESAKVSASITTRTDVDYNKAHQQLSVSVDTYNANIRDIFNDLTIRIEQNGRQDNCAILSKPLRVESNDVAVYEHLAPEIFKAGNEHRRMEIISINTPTMGVDEVVYEEPFYHAVLAVDAPRADGIYHYDKTQNGKFFIRELNSNNSDIEADYVITHFTLDMPEQSGYDIYLDGDFTYHIFDDNARMEYSRERGVYEKDLLLKQGAYNYQYLAVPKGCAMGETSLVEGDMYQTNNEYVIMVYARNQGERYDRLIAVKIINND